MLIGNCNQIIPFANGMFANSDYICLWTIRIGVLSNTNKVFIDVEYVDYNYELYYAYTPNNHRNETLRWDHKSRLE